MPSPIAIHQSSWTGSEAQRLPQLTCRPPQHAPVNGPRFGVPAGVECWVKPLAADAWQSFRTRLETGFSKFEYHETGYLVFRQRGYLLKVQSCHVIRNLASDQRGAK